MVNRTAKSNKQSVGVFRNAMDLPNIDRMSFSVILTHFSLYPI